MNICKITFLSLLLTSPLLHAEDAESTSPTWQQIDPAWSGVSRKVIDLVGEERQKVLADLSYAAVAGDICDNLSLDKAKFQTTFDSTFNATNLSSPTTEQISDYGQKVAMFFGVYVGLLTADGLLERNNFCDAAQQMHANGEGRYWLKK